MITKINPVIYTHSLKDSLDFYTNETKWFVFDIDLGMNYIRLKSVFLNNFYLSIQEKKDFSELHKLCLNLYVENIEKEFSILNNTEFNSGAKLILHQNHWLDTPLGKFLSILDPAGNEIVLIESDYL